MILKPLKDKLIVTTKKIDKTSVGGIVISNNTNEQVLTGIVKAKNKSVEEISIGETVLFNKFACSDFNYNSLNYYIIDKNDCIAILND